MKEMNFAALQRDDEGVLAKIEQILKSIPNKPAHKRIFKYNAAHAFMNLRRFEECISNTSELIEEYYGELGLVPESALMKNPDEIFPLLKKGVDHRDNLKHLGDTLDLQATALSQMGVGSGLARIHAIKFYAMANALDSVIRVGQDLADEL